MKAHVQRLTFGIGLLALTFARSLAACSCAPPPPPCQAIGQSQLVFLGTVTEMGDESRGFKRAQMHVDRVYKGALKDRVELYDDGMCDGPSLEVGRQYLMYTQGDPQKALPARGCTRSRAVEYAAEDLAFLKRYSSGTSTMYVSGIVRFRPDEPEDSRLGEAGRMPLRDVTVYLNGNGEVLRADTDASGKYIISAVKPGEYRLTAELSGYRLNWAPESVKVYPKGCAEANLLMKVDRRVQGVVRNRDGEPVPNVMLEMISTKSDLKRWQQPILLGETDAHGRYSIEGIPTGEYYLGINIQSTPTKRNPIPKTFYPFGSEISQATPVAIGVGASLQQFDLQIPSQLDLIDVQGRVLNADHEAPRAGDHANVRIKEAGLYGQIEDTPIVVDADGRFHIELCAGIRYSAFAFGGATPKQFVYSAPIEFVPTKEHDKIELVLDRTSKEFNKLSRQLEQ